MKIINGLKLFVLLFLIGSNSLIDCFLKTSNLNFRVNRKSKKLSKSKFTNSNRISRTMVGLSSRFFKRSRSKRESEMAKFEFRPFEYDASTVFYLILDGVNTSNYENDMKKNKKSSSELEDPSLEEMKTFVDTLLKTYKDASGNVDDEWHNEMYTFLRLVLAKKGNWKVRQKTQQLQIIEYLKASAVKGSFHLLENADFISKILNKSITDYDSIQKVKKICTEVSTLQGSENSSCKSILEDIAEIETENQALTNSLQSQTEMNIPTNPAELPDNDLVDKLDLACKRAMADAMPPKFCWRQGGQVVPSAPNSYTRYGLLYYENCPEDKSEFFGGFCRIKCNENEYTLPEHCAKKGKLFDWRSRQATFATIKNMFDEGATCPETMPNRIGALCYRTCPVGTDNCGCCACSPKDQCANQIVKMVVGILSGLAKLVLFILTAGAGGVAAKTLEATKKAVEIIVNVVEAIVNMADTIVGALADTYRDIIKQNNNSDSEGKAAFTKHVFGIGWIDYLKSGESIKTGDIRAKRKKFKDVCEPKINEKWDEMKKAKEELDASKQADDILKEIYLDAAKRIGSADAFKLWESTDQLMSINAGTIIGSVTSITNLVKQVKDSTGSSSENVETAKLVVGVIENWDPTGISSIVNAVLHPRCKDDPNYGTEGTKIAGLSKVESIKNLKDKVSGIK